MGEESTQGKNQYAGTAASPHVSRRTHIIQQPKA